jgi:hypothetical protein
VLFRRCALGELSGAEQRIGGARSKKPSEGSRWHGGRGLSTEAEEGPARVWERESIFENGVIENGK